MKLVHVVHKQTSQRECGKGVEQGNEVGILGEPVHNH
jgi:hypothetical protein